MRQTARRAGNYKLIAAILAGLGNFRRFTHIINPRQLAKMVTLSGLVFGVIGLGLPQIEVKSQPVSYKRVMMEIPETTVHDYATDRRTLALAKYLKDQDSPVADKAAVYVFAADYYNLKPWPILAAIAGKESSFCKRIPEASYNCYGWGITGGRVIKFQSYDEGIMIVAEGLRRRYYDKGLDTIPEIERRYTPISAATHHAWQKGVFWFVGQIEAEYHQMIQMADVSVVE